MPFSTNNLTCEKILSICIYNKIELHRTFLKFHLFFMFQMIFRWRKFNPYFFNAVSLSLCEPIYRSSVEFMHIWSVLRVEITFYDFLVKAEQLNFTIELYFTFLLSLRILVLFLFLSTLWVLSMKRIGIEWKELIFENR